jgi:dTDP-4-amino-4,6-dideoxygalactose transaminase
MLKPITVVKKKVWPAFDEEMIDAAARVLRSCQVNYWTGNEGRCFEAEMAELLGRPYTVALTNGSAALELALRALGIGSGDDVVTTPRSFIASASCAIRCGARPVFADVDRNSGTISAETIEAALTPNTRAIVVVHLGGWPCEMEPILELARHRSLKVIEDVAQALGGSYKGLALGSWGDVGAFSFCADKILTTAGEGGLVATNDESTFKKTWSMRDHGRDWDLTHSENRDPGYRWVRHEFGENHRMTELQAAVGRVGLRRLSDWLASRRRNAAILAQRLSGISALRVPAAPDGHAYYLSYVYLRPERLKRDWTRDRILTELLKLDVPCSVGSCGELYLERAFDHGGLRPSTRLPVARELGETALAFQVHPSLSEDNMHEMSDDVHRVFAHAAL